MSSATYTKTLPRASQRRQYNVFLGPTIPEVANEDVYEHRLGKTSSRVPTPVLSERRSTPLSAGMLRDLSGSYDPEGQKRRRRWLLQVRGWFVRPTRLYGLSIRSIVLILVGLCSWFAYVTRHSPATTSSQVSSTWQLSGNSGGASMASRVAASRKAKIGLPRSLVPLKQRDRAPLPRDIQSHIFPSHPMARGLLHVNGELPVAAHPIYQAIRDAREQWDAKVSRQSKSLYQATMEYRRRYGRAPPKGFEKWWRYVVENNVQLPDEYDQIHADVSLFQAFSPRDLQAKVKQASLRDGTFTIRTTGGNVRMTSTFREEDIPGGFDRMSAQAELLRPIAQDLDDLTIVFSAHDTPSAIVGYDYRRELQDHIEDQEYVDPDTEVDLSVKGWAAACPPNSPLRSHFPSAFEFDEGSSIERKRFIVDHEETMDLCQHPESVSIHGLTSGKDPWVQELVPIFALSKTKLHSDILGVPTEQWSDLKDLQPVQWEAKKRQELLWRGSNTGSHFSDNTNWRESHRIRLVRMADEAVGTLTMLASPKSPGKSGSIAQAVESHPRLDVNEKYMDVGFTSAPIQCDVADGTCDEIKELYSFLPMVSQEDSLHYKYSIDVDGNAWSARFRRQLATGTLNFKSTIMPEWWTQRIQPWVHYVPIHTDYSDLYDALSFFRGDMAGNAGEDALAKDIAEAGQDWASTHWRQEDMTAYVFRLYLEWGRLLAPNRSSKDFTYQEAMEVDFET